MSMTRLEVWREIVTCVQTHHSGYSETLAFCRNQVDELEAAEEEPEIVQVELKRRSPPEQLDLLFVRVASNDVKIEQLERSVGRLSNSLIHCTEKLRQDLKSHD
ncbi:hypothetical protein LCGC14_3054980, partial [marine sediment metagenome]